MTGDWLDRVALLAGQPVSRRSLLKLTASLPLAPSLLAALARPTEARAAATDSGDCLECALTTDARNAADLRACGVAIALAASPLLLGARVACAGILFANWYDGYDHCWPSCKPQPRPNERTPSRGQPNWDAPAQKAPPPPPPPPEPKKPTKKKPKKNGKKSGGNPPPPPPPPLCKSCAACCACVDGPGQCCCNCCYTDGRKGCKSICGG
jgi:hypothetical protein